MMNRLFFWPMYFFNQAYVICRFKVEMKEDNSLEKSLSITNHMRFDKEDLDSIKKTLEEFIQTEKSRKASIGYLIKSERIEIEIPGILKGLPFRKKYFVGVIMAFPLYYL